MLSKQRQIENKRWSRGDYTPNVIVRGLLLLVLWVFYALIPHRLNSLWLLLVTALMLGYSHQLSKRKATVMFPLMVVAAALNTVLIFLLPLDEKTMYPITLLPIVIIYFILVIDIVFLPRGV